MDAYQYGNGFARLVQVLRARGGDDLRAELSAQARAALAGNRDLIGLYLVFQPNALDQQDARFIGQDAQGSNDSGRYSLYWSQPSKQHVDDVAQAFVGRHGLQSYRAYVAKVGRSREIELYFIVPTTMAARTIAEWDALRDEIGEAIGGEGLDRWLTVVFTGDPEWAE